eukprot:gene3399-3889_t
MSEASDEKNQESVDKTSLAIRRKRFTSKTCDSSNHETKQRFDQTAKLPVYKDSLVSMVSEFHDLNANCQSFKSHKQEEIEEATVCLTDKDLNKEFEKNNPVDVVSRGSVSSPLQNAMSQNKAEKDELKSKKNVTLESIVTNNGLVARGGPMDDHIIINETKNKREYRKSSWINSMRCNRVSPLPALKITKSTKLQSIPQSKSANNNCRQMFPGFREANETEECQRSTLIRSTFYLCGTSQISTTVGSFHGSRIIKAINYGRSKHMDASIFDRYDFPHENLVFEGGGNKGTAYVGAIERSIEFPGGQDCDVTRKSIIATLTR